MYTLTLFCTMRDEEDETNFRPTGFAAGKNKEGETGEIDREGEREERGGQWASSKHLRRRRGGR